MEETFLEITEGGKKEANDYSQSWETSLSTHNENKGKTF